MILEASYAVASGKCEEREWREETYGEVEDGNDGHSNPFHPEKLRSHDSVS